MRSWVGGMHLKFAGTPHKFVHLKNEVVISVSFQYVLYEWHHDSPSFSPKIDLIKSFSPVSEVCLTPSGRFLPLLCGPLP